MRLIDTSLWIEWLRGSQTPATDRLAEAIVSPVPIFMAPVILQEILQGARNDEQLLRWQRFFGGLRRLIVTDPFATRAAAARLYLRCRLVGITPRSGNDCLIAQLAIESRLVLIHRDKDFTRMATAVPELRHENWDEPTSPVPR
jgi:predicted nucleic acid-binding protein